MSWRENAICRGVDPSVFFPAPAGDDNPEPELAARGKAICEACPVRRPCLVFAFETRDFDGILGGTTGHERKRMLKSGRRVA